MMRRLWPILLLLAALPLLTACEEVLEFPEWETPEPEPTALTLQLRYDTSMPLYRVVERNGSRSTSAALIRHTIRLYPPDALPMSSPRDTELEGVVTIIRTYPASEGLDRDIRLELPGINDYQVYVWTDYLPYDGHPGFYDPASFDAITLSTPHAGSEPLRDAFCGTAEVRMQENVNTLCQVSMQRPLAMFRFISTDLADFVDGTMASKSGVDPADYRIVFRYTGYMPNIFNMFIDHPTGSDTGVTFDSQMRLLDTEEAELGYDFVFVNGTPAQVSVALDVYDRSGALLAYTSTINIPLLRSHVTEVRGRFLTASASGGIGIDPSFDGDYNIQIF